MGNVDKRTEAIDSKITVNNPALTLNRTETSSLMPLCYITGTILHLAEP